MFLLAAAVYSKVMRECFSQQTSATISTITNQIVLNLAPLANAECDFPRGVLLQLFFTQPGLDIADMYANYDFKATKQLTVSFACDSTTCPQYDAIQYLKFRLDSPQLTTELAVGAVVNCRLESSECSTSTVAVVMMPQSNPAYNMFALSIQTQCARVTGMNVTTATITSIMHDGGQVQTRVTGNNLMISNSGTYMIMFRDLDYYDAIIGQSAKFTTAVLEGWIGTIFATQELFPSGMAIINLVKYIKSWTVKLGHDDLLLTNIQDVDYAQLAGMFESKEFTEVKASIILTQGTIRTEQLLYNVSPQVLLEGGSLLCDDTSDPARCQSVFSAFEDIDANQLYVLPTLQFWKNDKMTHVESFFVSPMMFATSCFSFSEVYATPEQVAINITLRSGRIKCKLEQTAPTVIAISYFETKDDRTASKDGSVKTAAQFMAPFSIKNQSLTVPIDKKVFEELKTSFQGAYSMQISFLRETNGVMTFLDNACVESFQYSDDKRVQKLNIYLVAGFTLGVIACGIAEQIVCKMLSKRKRRRVQKKAEVLDDM